MSRLNTPEESSLQESTLAAARPYRQGNQLAAAYLQIANSEPALVVYLAMETALSNSTLTLTEIEAVKLLVSELNQCEFCLAIHHVKAGMAGLTDEQKMAIRKGDSLDDHRLNSIVSTVRECFTQPGSVSDERFADLRQAGLTDAELVDLALVASTIFFTNTFNRLNKTAVIGKPAPGLSG